MKKINILFYIHLVLLLVFVILLFLSCNHIEIKKYWDINKDKNNIMRKTEKYFVKKIQNIFEDSVKKRLISDVPLGVYLSGGIDSSAVVAMMKKISPYVF